MSTSSKEPCAGRAAGTSPVPGNKVVVPERESWASGSVKEGTAFQWGLIGTSHVRWQS